MRAGDDHGHDDRMSSRLMRNFVVTKWEGPDDEGYMRCVATLGVAGAWTLSERRYKEGQPYVGMAEQRAIDMLLSGIRSLVND